ICDITQHATQAAGDYAGLAAFDFRTVRESVGWRVVDRAGRLDFSPLASRARAARSQRLQVIWTLCHYGWPSDLDVFSAAFVDRVARYARAAAEYLGEFVDGTPIYAPINEISFLSSAVCESGRIGTGDRRMSHRSDELRRQLVRAALAACDAIWSVDA